MNSKTAFNSFAEVTRKLTNENNCKEYLAWVRWHGKPKCPYCGCERVYHKKDGRYACAGCKNTFSVLVGTIFQNTKLPLATWFKAIFLICNSKKGISSCQLSMILGITQKTAWFMLQKLRIMLKENTDDFPDVVQGDIKEKRNRKGKLFKIRLSDGPLIIHPMLYKYIIPSSRIFRDHRICYQTLLESEKSRYQIEDPYPINYFENNADNQHIVDCFWQQLKRMVMGVNHYVSSSHFHRYVYEALFRRNYKDESNGVRFCVAMNRIHCIIPYYVVSPKNSKVS